MGFQQNIRNNFTRGISCLLLTDKYYDYMLYKGDAVSLSTSGECLASFIDMNDDSCYLSGGGIASSVSWEDAKSGDITLENFGMTGIDNGIITYNKDEITQEEFNTIFFNTHLNLKAEDTKLELYPVSGNTGVYSYEYSYSGDTKDRYLKLNGGFFQGFFKVPDENYEVLPYYIDEDWHFEFVIRPQSGYTESGNTLNASHSGNTGIFFYIGARAENKFAEISNKTDKYVTPYSGKTYDIDKELSTSIIKTNNKHIFFNRTSTGSTVHNQIGMDEDGFTELIVDNKKEYKDNAFTLFHRADGGYTASDVKNGLADDIYDYDKSDYNIMKDIIGNAFALKYNSDGSISYKYTMKDCSSESGYTIESESTKSGLIRDGEWNVINVRFTILDHAKDDCGFPVNLGNRRMKIMIYVNGFLVLVSKELTEFNFRKLAVRNEFQEGVPFNISLGGGTQGLCERVLFDYKNPPTEHYYLENEYAGTFIGDIRSFKIYTCMKQYIDIWNNYRKEITEEIKIVDMDTDSVYYGFYSNEYEVVNGDKKIRGSFALNYNFEDICEKDGESMYIITSKKFKFKKPINILMNGFPIEMDMYEKTINGHDCIVYRAKAEYSIGTKLNITTINS